MNKCLWLVLVVVLLCSCTKKPETLLQARLAGDTNIDFENKITISDTLNALNFEYIYNGSGVGIADFNQDGLEDLFFVPTSKLGQY